MAEGERGGEEGASERRKMGATRYVLGSAILGLFWSSLLKGVLTNSTSRCDYPPCSCDHYGRLTCDCKEEGEVGSTQTVSLISIRVRVDFRLNLGLISRKADEQKKYCSPYQECRSRHVSFDFETKKCIFSSRIPAHRILTRNPTLYPT